MARKPRAVAFDKCSVCDRALLLHFDYHNRKIECWNVPSRNAAVDKGRKARARLDAYINRLAALPEGA